MRVKSFNKSTLDIDKLSVFPQVQKLSYIKNEIVITEKDKSKGFYLVVNGETQSSLANMNLCLYRKGMAFGFQSVFEPQTDQVYTCVCNTDTELLFIRFEIITQVLSQFPEIWKVLFESACIEVGAAQKKSRISYSFN